MREEILSRIHDGHQGIQKSMLKARNSVHWLGLQRDITKMIQGCIHCAGQNRSQQKEQQK